MNQREKVIGIAVATALGVGTFAAIRYNRNFVESMENLRGQVVGMVVQQIKYEELSTNPKDLADFCQQIPGEWRISSVLADIMSDQQSGWIDNHGLYKSLSEQTKPPSVFLIQLKPADSQLKGLYLRREHVDPVNTTSFFRDMVKIGNVRNFLVGENYIPRELRRKIKLGLS